MELDVWFAYFAACWVISLTPGAGAIASMTSGLSYGFRRGYWNALGLQLALALQIGIVAAGGGALLATSELAFGLIKWFGVAYLVWLTSAGANGGRRSAIWPRNGPPVPWGGRWPWCCAAFWSTPAIPRRSSLFSRCCRNSSIRDDGSSLNTC